MGWVFLVDSFVAGHRKIHVSDLRQLDVHCYKLFRRVVIGPSASRIDGREKTTGVNWVHNKYVTSGDVYAVGQSLLLDNRFSLTGERNQICVGFWQFLCWQSDVDRVSMVRIRGYSIYFILFRVTCKMNCVHTCFRRWFLHNHVGPCKNPKMQFGISNLIQVEVRLASKSKCCSMVPKSIWVPCYDCMIMCFNSVFVKQS